MGKKIFVSYKYADDQVEHLGDDDSTTTVRDYVTALEDSIDSSDHIYKGEHDDEDLSQLEDDTIWEKLKDKIYDSTVTVVFISPGMRDTSKKDRDQWIPWEISYSLKETSRKNKNGDPITSKSNAMLAVVLPDTEGKYSYYLNENNCCAVRCITHYTGKLFSILKNNKFNYTKKKKYACDKDKEIWQGTCSYIEAVKWCDFKKNINFYIDKAIDRQANIDDYDIQKDVE
jgi:hypothetical protein